MKIQLNSFKELEKARHYFETHGVPTKEVIKQVSKQLTKEQHNVNKHIHHKLSRSK